MTDSSDKKEPSQNHATNPRRKLLRYLVAGGSLGTGAALVPSTWTKPVVDAVILPAHAETSIVPFNGTGLVGSIIIDTQYREPDNESGFMEFVERVRSVVISDAHADHLPEPFLFCIAILVENLLDESSSATCTLTSNTEGVDTGNGTLGQLLSGGIITTNGHVVVANELNPGDGGSGTVDGITFELTGGSCEPQDGGETPFPV